MFVSFELVPKLCWFFRQKPSMRIKAVFDPSTHIRCDLMPAALRGALFSVHLKPLLRLGIEERQGVGLEADPDPFACPIARSGFHPRGQGMPVQA